MDTALSTELYTRHRPETLGDRVYRALRARVMLGEFSPRTRLVEERVAEGLQVSRTPVREALTRLCADGLIERQPDGGLYVAEPRVDDVRDLYAVRIALELSGLQRALDWSMPHDVSILEPLRDDWRALAADPPPPDPEFVDLDEAFHLELCRSSGNLPLVETLAGVNARIRPVRMYDFLTEDRVRLTIDEHLTIVETVLGGGIPASMTLLRQHIGESMAVVEERATRAIVAMTLRRGRAQ
jgi:DNA-binding GntR family transcriptional regulator